MKKRIFALLTVLILVFGLASADGASKGITAHVKETDSANTWGDESSRYLLKKGETATFYYCADYMGNLMRSRDGNIEYITDVEFDTPYAVKAKCTASWIHIKNTSHGFYLTSDPNETYKNRTATVKITGKKYSAKLKLIQLGNNTMTSVVRNKKKVTVKLKMAEGTLGGFLNVFLYKIDDPDNTSQNIPVSFPKGASSVSFKVKAGWDYYVGLYAYYDIGDDAYDSTDGVDFRVTKENIGQKETIR